MFYHRNGIYILYNEGFILEVIDEEEISQTLFDTKAAGMDINKEAEIEDFPRVNIEKVDSNIYIYHIHSSSTKFYLTWDFHIMTQLQGLHLSSQKTYWELVRASKTSTNNSTITEL